LALAAELVTLAVFAVLAAAFGASLFAVLAAAFGASLLAAAVFATVRFAGAFAGASAGVRASFSGAAGAREASFTRVEPPAEGRALPSFDFLGAGTGGGSDGAGGGSELRIVELSVTTGAAKIATTSRANCGMY
jgi:hypothetical protein